MFDELRGGTCILGRRFHLFGSSEGGIFRFRGRSVVVAELKGDICILGRRFQVQSLWLGSSEGGIFSGLEGAWLCLMNSGAAFAFWGAVFICLGAQRAAFFRFRECLVVVAEFRAAFASWEAVFQEQRALDGAAGFRGRHFLHVHRALCRCRARGGIFSKGCHFSEQVGN